MANVRPVLNRSETDGIRKWLNAEIKYLKDEIEDAKKAHERETPEVSEGLYWTVTFLATAVLVIIEFLNIKYVPREITAFGIPFAPQWILHVAIAVYLAFGFRSVAIDKVAGIDFAGKPVSQLGNGLTWFFYGLFTYTEESAFLVQAEFPGDANHIDWGPEKDPLTPGKVRPIYVQTGENPNGTLPSDKQTNLGIAALAKIQTTKERFFDLVRNTPPIDPENGAEILQTIVGNSKATPRLLEIVRYLRDTMARIAAEIVGQLSYGELTAHRALIDKWSEERLRLEVTKWGVELREGGFTILNPGHDYNEAQNKRQEASATRDATVMVAEGEAKAITLKGDANNNVLKGQFEAEAAGKKAIKDALEVSGEAILASELGEKIAEGGNTVIADGLGGLGAMFRAGTEAMENAKGKKT